MAVFGQLEFAVGDAGRLTIGTRIERREVEYIDTSGLDLAPNDPMIGGEIAYNHTFSERTSGFARLSRGYKGGGFNLGLVPVGSREFDSEYLWSLELGARTNLVDDRLFLNGTIFYNLRDEQQVETSFQLDPNDPASFVFYTANAAQGDAVGVELEVSWLPTDNLELYLNLGLLNATFDTFVTPLVDASGRDQAHAPSYTFAAGAAYTHDSGWFGRFDVSGMDEFYFDVSHDQVSESYAIANARLGYQADRWSAQLWLRNAFDERYAVRGFFFGNEPPLFPPTLYIRQGDPRHAGVTFDWRF